MYKCECTRNPIVKSWSINLSCFPPNSSCLHRFSNQLCLLVYFPQQLTPESNTQQTAQWLRKNSFGNYLSTFANFNGADILRLTREDLIQICGLPDGIRLLYALHSKWVSSRMVLKMRRDELPQNISFFWAFSEIQMWNGMKKIEVFPKFYFKWRTILGFFLILFPNELFF